MPAASQYEACSHVYIYKSTNNCYDSHHYVLNKVHVPQTKIKRKRVNTIKNKIYLHIV